MRVLIALPAYNEEAIIEVTVKKLLLFCRRNFSFPFEIVVADNRSTDGTAAIVRQLAAVEPEVSYLYVGVKGKGAAIKAAWRKEPADVYVFMDADLATDLSALPALIGSINDGFDLAIGSRVHRHSRVERTLSRRFFSLGYRLVLRIFIGLKAGDAPCGFKAVSRKVKEEILPLIEDNEWFFDSELLILAERKGFKIKEVPVDWRDPRQGGDKSRVQAFSLSREYFRRVLALKKRLKR